MIMKAVKLFALSLIINFFYLLSLMDIMKNGSFQKNFHCEAIEKSSTQAC